MCELRRCLLNGRNLLVLLILITVNVIFATMQCNETQEITLQGEALENYLAQYPEYVEKTLANAEQMKLLGMLGKQDDFGYRNIEATAEDFAKMQSIRVEAGENRGAVLYGNSNLTGFLLAGYGIYLVLLFTGEYKKGLSLLIYSTKRGRITLGLWRIGILSLGLFFCTACLYGSSLAVFSYYYPGADYSRALQSVPEFMKCTWELSIGQYVLLLAFIKMLTALVICMGLFAAIALIRNMAAVVLAGVVLLGEVLAYQLILPTATTNLLKYCNVYGILQKQDGFVNYLNLNLLGTPVSLLPLQCFFLIGVLAIFLGLTLWGQCRKAPEGVAWLRQLVDRITRWLQLHKPVHSPLYWEGYKLLVSERGLLILAAVLYLAVSASLQTRYTDFNSKMERLYYEEYGGEMTHEKLAKAKKEASQMEKYYQNARKNLEKEDENTSPASKEATRRRIRELELKLPGLKTISENLESGLEYMDRTGQHITLMEPFNYELLLFGDGKTYRRNTMYCLIGMLLLFSGVLSFEKTSGTGLLLHSLPYGRKRIRRNIICWLLVMAILLALPIHLTQFYQIHQRMPFGHFSEKVQSLVVLRDFPLYISIRWYLIGLYAVRCLMAAGAGAGAMLAGIGCKTRIQCVAVCMVFFLAGMLAIL